MRLVLEELLVIDLHAFGQVQKTDKVLSYAFSDLQIFSVARPNGDLIASVFDRHHDAINLVSICKLFTNRCQKKILPELIGIALGNSQSPSPSVLVGFVFPHWLDTINKL